MMEFRTLVPLCLVATAIGCADHGGPVGDVDYWITGPIGQTDGTALHIGPDGDATRSVPSGNTQTTVLDPHAVADLHTKIDAAQFPDLAPLYACTGLCPDIASNVLHVTVRLGGHPYTSAADSWYLSSTHGNVPAGLVTTIQALQQIFDQADWH